MNIRSNAANPSLLQVGPSRGALLFFALLALLGPNGLYLYAAITEPQLNQEALRNPVALAFIVEALMLVMLFLWYVYARTRSLKQVVLYCALSFAGSLAFSLPLFLYRQRRDG